MRTVIILGTGTEVGKTYAAVQIAKAIEAHWAGVPVLAIKPIETGVVPGAITDASKLAAASRPLFEPTHAFSFEPPISPHLAARHAGSLIDIEHVARWTNTYRARCAPDGWLVIETAGGVFSPINNTETNLELAQALEPACWVLIAADSLGVLHNVRATLLAMERLARAPDIVLLNSVAQVDCSAGTNRVELERLGWARVTAQVERNGAFDARDRTALVEELTRAPQR